MVTHKIYTTVGITKNLKDELDRNKLCPTETYEHLIRRLVDEFQANQEVIHKQND